MSGLGSGDRPGGYEPYLPGTDHDQILEPSDFNTAKYRMGEASDQYQKKDRRILWSAMRHMCMNIVDEM